MVGIVCAVVLIMGEAGAGACEFFFRWWMFLAVVQRKDTTPLH
jgi:hypothetical protein